MLLVRLTSAAAPAALSLSLTLTTSLRTLVMRTPARLREDTILLNLAVKTLERQLKRIARVHSDFTHRMLPA
ncbi:MAG: hypothetical protein AUG54_04835 [Ktedonobacter sp. 13_1_20CM_4_53_7]|nr:MAG: hypothetical protein AUH05_22110 [Ktedonobacter sp. 13_2_20CM_53_11]OLD80780.1 MAG: hypothetical protein AUG54_04835 [Ktedonobacter sp. 13_1_20CM_4_53_7]